MKLMNRRLLMGMGAALLLLVGAGCDSSDSEGMPLAMYENEVGEAVVRHLIATAPDPSPGVPKSWSIVLGEIGRNGVFEPATVPFLEKFQEAGRRVISASVLSHAEPDHMIIDPELRVAVYVLQLKSMKQRAVGVWDVEAAWSYKKFFQRKKFEVNQGADGKWTVKDGALLEGNWETGGVQGKE
jgi:hypothetical protein